MKVDTANQTSHMHNYDKETALSLTLHLGLFIKLCIRFCRKMNRWRSRVFWGQMGEIIYAKGAD